MAEQDDCGNALQLSIKNAHPRDSLVEFDEPTHVYTIDGEKGYISVTTWIHSFFPKFDAPAVIRKMRCGKNWTVENKYYNMTDAQIIAEWNNGGESASSLGTEMHRNIENYYNGEPFSDEFKATKECFLFTEYLADHKEYSPFRTEWAVYSKAYKIAGCMDMVYIDPADPEAVVIADWKRAKEIKFENRWERGHAPISEIQNCNYWHYTLQLNLYRMILEKYYGKRVSEMFLVILHPTQEHYIKIPVKKVTAPLMKMLAHRKAKLSNN